VRFSHHCSRSFATIVLLLSFFLIFEVQASIGIAKNVSVTGRAVTMNLYIENLHATDTLSSVVISDDLDAVYGAGNYTLTQQPQRVSGPGTITLNGSYDGSGDTNIASSGSLLIGETVHIQFAIEITTPSDQGSGLGIYSNQASVSAEDTLSTAYNDISDDGSDPDPNGNGDPGDAGEDDATIIDIVQNPIIGVAKNATVNSNQVTFDFYLENFGNRVLSSLTLVDDLDSIFGAGNYTVTSGPQLIDDPGTITLNSSFDGSANTGLIVYMLKPKTFSDNFEPEPHCHL